MAVSKFTQLLDVINRCEDWFFGVIEPATSEPVYVVDYDRIALEHNFYQSIASTLPPFNDPIMLTGEDAKRILESK